MPPPSAYLLEIRRLHQAQLEAPTPEARAAADQALGDWLRLQARRRDREPIDVKAVAARNDA